MRPAKKILLADDDADFRHGLCEQLQLHEDFEIFEAETGAEVFAKLHDRQFDLVLLDVLLPDMDGREVCRILRRNGVDIPVIMLTVADSDPDTILGLNAGANDYIIKPFHFGVLLARLRAQLRQHEQSDNASYTIGHYIFRPSANLLTDSQTERIVSLTPKEAATLEYLARAGGDAVSRDNLLNEVWRYQAGVTTHTVETHIYRLRQKIEDNPSDPEILVSEMNGYRLAK